MEKSKKGIYFLLISRKYLYIVSGIIWLVVGLMLVNFSITWLLKFNGDNRWIYVTSGLILALIKYRFVFIRVDKRNTARIMEMESKAPIYSFIPASSYAIILIMIVMGILLRHSSLPKEYLAIAYLGIGLSLFYSGLGYFKVFKRANSKLK